MDFFFWMGCLLQNETEIIMFFLVITYFQYYQSNLTCENSRFSSVFSARDVSRGGTSATQRQKFHGDDVNQYLHNTSGSHGVPHPNLFNFTFPLIDFTRVFFLSANELQQNSNAPSREQYIPPILTVFVRDSSRLHLIFVAFCLLGHPNKMFRFPSPRLLWWWVGRSGKKQRMNTWRGLGSKEGWAAK